MKKRFFCSVLLSAAACFNVSAENLTIKPQGAYAAIDTSKAIQTMRGLANPDPLQRRMVVDAVLAHPETYAPPVFFSLSHALLADGRKDDALFWFYAGQLRARFDANRCADESARSAVSVLTNNYGPPINQYAFQNLSRLEALIPTVVEWDRSTPHNYDPHWINLHGMNAILGGDSAMSKPEPEWESIAEQTRKDYLSGFQQALAAAKEKQR